MDNKYDFDCIPEPQEMPRAQKFKYNNKPTTCHGKQFSSKKEASRYAMLYLLEQTGKITRLECQPSFQIVIRGQKICRYIADFRYTENGKQVVEDVKSEPTKTPIYRLKKKLMKAVFDIDIVEV